MKFEDKVGRAKAWIDEHVDFIAERQAAGIDETACQQVIEKLQNRIDHAENDMRVLVGIRKWVLAYEQSWLPRTHGWMANRGA